MERIVVGIDGSEASRHALRFALDCARRRGAVLEAVHAYHHPPFVGMPIPGAPPMTTSTYELAAKQAHATLDEMLDREILVGGFTSVPVERIVVEGAAATSLIEVARGADLLVVGSRGLGGFKGLLLGSVSQQCVTHAPCPVAVVPVPPGA